MLTSSVIPDVISFFVIRKYQKNTLNWQKYLKFKTNISYLLNDLMKFYAFF